VEVFEDGGKVNIEGCCTVKAVSINSTAARIEIFTHYNMMLINSIFSSASKSIICFPSFRFTHKSCAFLLLIPNATHETHPSRLRENNSKRKVKTGATLKR
jgi:hypothetical protein